MPCLAHILLAEARQKTIPTGEWKSNLKMCPGRKEQWNVCGQPFNNHMYKCTVTVQERVDSHGTRRSDTAASVVRVCIGYWSTLRWTELQIRGRGCVSSYIKISFLGTRPMVAQVVISLLVSSSPAAGSVLTARSSEPGACFGFCLLLAASPPACSLSLSNVKKKSLPWTSFLESLDSLSPFLNLPLFAASSLPPP